MDGALKCSPLEVQDRTGSKKRRNVGNKPEDFTVYHQVSTWAS